MNTNEHTNGKRFDSHLIHVIYHSNSCYSNPANDENLPFLEAFEHTLHVHLILSSVHAHVSAGERVGLDADNAGVGALGSGLLDNLELLVRAVADLGVDNTSAVGKVFALVDPRAIHAEVGPGKDGAFERNGAVVVLDELEGLIGADEGLCVDCAATRGFEIFEPVGVEAEELSGGSLGLESDEDGHDLHKSWWLTTPNEKPRHVLICWDAESAEMGVWSVGVLRKRRGRKLTIHKVEETMR